MIRGIARRLWWKCVWLNKEGRSHCHACAKCYLLRACSAPATGRTGPLLTWSFPFKFFPPPFLLEFRNSGLKKKTCCVLMFSRFGWRVCVVKQVCGGALCEWAQADNLLKAQGLGFPCTLCSAYSVICIPAICLCGRTEGFFTAHSGEAHRSQNLRCYFLPKNIVILSATKVLGLMA